VANERFYENKSLFTRQDAPVSVTMVYFQVNQNPVLGERQDRRSSPSLVKSGKSLTRLARAGEHQKKS